MGLWQTRGAEHCDWQDRPGQGTVATCPTLTKLKRFKNKPKIKKSCTCLLKGEGSKYLIENDFWTPLISIMYMKDEWSYTKLIGGGGGVIKKGGVCPSERFLDPPPPPINFVHDHLFFSKFIIIYFFDI